MYTLMSMLQALQINHYTTTRLKPCLTRKVVNIRVGKVTCVAAQNTLETPCLNLKLPFMKHCALTFANG